MTPREATEQARKLWKPGTAVTGVLRYRIADVLGGSERQIGTVWIPDLGEFDSRGLPADTLTIIGIDRLAVLELPD